MSVQLSGGSLFPQWKENHCSLEKVNSFLARYNIPINPIDKRDSAEMLLSELIDRIDAELLP